MGYYTNYDVTVTTDNSNVDVGKAVTEFLELVVGTGIEGADELTFGENRVDFTLADRKWYDYARDVRRFAKNNPDLLIVIEGKGEGYDDDIDMWKHVFHNMQDQRVDAVVTFPDFSEPFENI